MSKTILDIVAQYASPGSSIQLTLLSQEKITGKIESINSAVLVIRQENGNIRLLKPDNIVDFEIISKLKKLEEKQNNDHVFKKKDQISQIDKIIEAPKEPEKNMLVKASTENKQTRINPYTVLFKRNVHLQAVKPDFKFDNITDGDRQELNRIKNKYDYAVKIHELGRIRQTIPELEEIAVNANNHKVYLLCGLFAKLMNDGKKAERYFQNSLALQNRQAAVMLAILSIDKKEWEQAASFLIYSFLSEKGDVNRVEELLISLGSCLYQIDNKELKGIGQIQSAIEIQSDKEILYAIISLALQDKYPEASSVALNGDLVEVSKLAIESPVFSPLAPFKADHELMIISTRKRSSASNLIYGHISAYYSERMYGFIVSTSNVTYYFHYRDVKDQHLRNELYKGTIGHKICFSNTTRTTGHKYDQALDIMLTEAGISPPDITFKQTSLITLPSKDSIYKRAKIAEQNKDFNKAANLYQQVIDNKGEYSNSAIKDYASLLNRIDKSNEAIAILDQYESRFDNYDSLNKMKVAFYIKGGEYSKASNLLKNIIKNAYGKQDKLNWLRQLAYSLMMDDKIDQSLELLNEGIRKYPKNQQLKGLHEKFENIKLTGRSGEIEELQGLAGISSGLSLFSQHLIKNCDFAGADERAKSRGFFSKRDFKEIKKLFDRIDGRRPKEKANLLITLAAMTEKSPEVAGDENANQILARAFAFMGEAATYEELDKDSIRFYLVESMRLGATRDRFELRFPLSFFLASYLSITPSPGGLLIGAKYDVEGTLQKIINDNHARNQLISDFAYFDILAPFAFDLLISISISISKKGNISIFSKSFLSIRNQTKQIVRDELYTEGTSFQALRKGNFKTKAIFQETASKLFELSSNTIFELDKQRMINIANINLDCEKYWDENDYVEKESKYNRIKTGIAGFIDDIYSKPTKVSFEQLTSLAKLIGSAIDAHFEQYKSNTKPDLELINILSDDYYVPDRNEVITLRLELLSKQGGAPVEGLEILAHKDDGMDLVEPAYSPEILKGGQRREIILKIKPSAKQFSQEAFTVRCYVSYKNRSGKNETTGDFSFAIRLGSYSDFTVINNPYQNYSGGRSVEDPKMFKGREDVINRIIEVVGKGLIGQCFVLYGQKRSGKTSILNQLRLHLPQNCVPVSLSLGEVDINLEKKKINFIELLIEKLQETLEDKFDHIPDTFPEKDKIVNEPNSSLRISLRETIKIIKRKSIKEPRIVLLIDEFTYVYEYIIEGSVSPDFMRSWKALLQMQLFSAVVVGQDSMPLFKQAFPNEFGVTHDDRISYLSRQETARLSSEPILLNGSSRFRGNAQERLFELSAGSPFYTNIICDRLVNFLNFRHAPFITEADIESVLFGWRGGEDEFSGLIVGADTLPLERFDPLITAAAESVATNKREDYLKILVAIAKSSDKKALLSDLPQLDNLNYILKDMNEREIISIDAARRYSIRVGLFAEWLNLNDILVDWVVMNDD